ncbi:HTTM domain-containing protein [Flavobacterium amnicola]|uniref:HTTM domain-containing protein n=1 Tax=Flavobacterium amnicola TaxID=2506422 RepID=A0A4Q1K1D3_9FLAO|nr:HTTM domain-containing protein [Flavobacterium amnicola]RXR17234.1 HTTM domain-containing protein [Flavobacterium amnicola]
MNFNIQNYLNTNTQASTLAFFRLAFGLMMVFSIIRFASFGWIDQFYIQPVFHFTYYGFEWVKTLGKFTYVLFAICGISALFVALGYKYKIAIITFFLSFTYIELMDKTTYLNHYYFISVVSFVLIFLPANATFSIDAFRNSKNAFEEIPRWTTDILKLLLGIVYFYAGLAKINSDWILEAMPLKIWLPNNSNLPLIGTYFNESWVHYAFSWSGMIYDLAIPFLLLYKRTRNLAFILVVVFHLMTKILFPIGIFPYVMIVSTLLFFDASFHTKCLKFIFKIFGVATTVFENGKQKVQQYNNINKVKLSFLFCFIIFQLAFPFRYLAYPDELFWTEEGYRFSWRVMLMEKAGYTQFTVTDNLTKKTIHINNRQFLTSFQEKQMSFQPDFILEYAHFLADYHKQLGMFNPEVRVESYVAINGRLSKLYIDPKINLAQENESFSHKNWILPFNDEIKGF